MTQEMCKQECRLRRCKPCRPTSALRGGQLLWVFRLPSQHPTYSTAPSLLSLTKFGKKTSCRHRSAAWHRLSWQARTQALFASLSGLRLAASVKLRFAKLHLVCRKISAIQPRHTSLHHRRSDYVLPRLPNSAHRRCH